MPSLSDLIWGVLVPALVAGLLLLASGRGTPFEERPRPVFGAIALGLGYLVAHVAILSWPPIPGGEQQLGARDWIPWFVAGAIVLAPLRNVKRLARFATPFYIALFSVLIFRNTLMHVLPDGVGSLAIRFGLTLSLYGVWAATEKLALRVNGPAIPASLVVTGIAISLSALFSHIFTIAQQTGAVVAGLGAAGVLALLDKRASLPIGAVAIAMIVYACALVNAAIYDLPRASWILLTISVLAPWLGESSRFARFSPNKKCLVDMAFAAVPAIVAVWLAWEAGARAETY
jgi:hypothetical protein